MTEEERLTLHELASRIAKLRHRVTKVCPVCGEKFEGLAVQKYDSAKCRVIDNRRKKKAAPPEDAPQ